MAFNEKIAHTIRQLFSLTENEVEEKRMFGGLCFMVNGKMCVGVEKDRLMVRLDPAVYEMALKKEGCRPMDFTGRVMKGYVFVDAKVLDTKAKIKYWVNLALDFNKVAVPGKKKHLLNKTK